MAHPTNTLHMPSFDEPLDPAQFGSEDDSRYLLWLKMNPEKGFEEWLKTAHFDLDLDILDKH